MQAPQAVLVQDLAFDGDGLHRISSFVANGAILIVLRLSHYRIEIKYR